MKNKLKIIFGIAIIFILLLSTKSFQIDESTAQLAAPTSSSTTGTIIINGNPDFEAQAAANSWPGDGTAEDPYIIADYFFQLSSSSHKAYRSGITISNTDQHFILLNCIFHFPLPWDMRYGGFLFENVINGKIIGGYVAGTQYLLDGYYPTKFAIRLLNCENITVEDFRIVNVGPGPTYYPVYYGVYAEDSHYINITNCELPASNPISAIDSTDLTIRGNLMQWGSGSPEWYVRHNTGIHLNNCNNSVVADNIIMNFFGYGIYLRGASDSNTIVDNTFYSNYGGVFIQDNTPTTVKNFFLKISTPDNKFMYEGPDTPSPGYYPASSYNTAGDGFDNEEDGPLQLSGWTGSGTGTSTIQASKIDSYNNDHKKVLECYTGTGTSYSVTHDTTEIHESGTVEFWFLKDDSGSASAFFGLLDNSDNDIFKIILEDDLFKYSDNSTIKNSNIPVEDNKWYRISIDYSTDGSYASLGSSYRYQFRIYDSDGKNLLFTSPIAMFDIDAFIQSFQLQVQGGISSDLTVYLDALGHYWPENSDSITGYNVGDNQAEGMLLTYSLQRMGIDYPRLGYSVNKGPSKFITWNLANPWDPDYDKLVIPLPTNDGFQNISLFWADSAGAPQSSNIKHFNTYFRTYLSVYEYLENGIGYPPGTMVLSDDDDLTIGLTYTSKDWYLQDSWSNASFSYKINDDVWMGPYVFSSGLGLQNANFTIGAGNYSIFDNLYYYVTLDQYDDSDYSNHLETYYLAQESEVLFSEDAARTAAFRKKISPIPYELTLNYGVYYQSQINAITSYFDDLNNAVNITTFPFVDILNQNVSLDFYNTTASLEEYSISCFNESLLNHVMAGDTSNISTSIDPLFSYSQEISSPFLLPENMNFTTGTPDATHHKYLSIPAISFSYLPGYNLSFTGGVFNVTYAGTEQWPDSSHFVHKFVDSINNVVIRYDSTTKIMIYFEYINDTIVNRNQRTTLVLMDNNASYPINIKIDWYDEIISSGVEIIPNHLLAIVYDPPGDHSFGQISSGTTITKGFSVTQEKTKTYVDEWKTLYFGQGKDTGLSGAISDIAGVITKIPGLGDALTSIFPGLGLPPGQHEISKSITKGTSTDYEFSVTYSSTFTSSLNSEDPDLIGPGGGDLYYGTGMILYWTVKHRVRYINTTTASNSIGEKLQLWNGSNWMEYGLAFNSSFTVLGAYLDDYGLGNLTKMNPFLNNDFNSENYGYLQEYQTGTMFWTPDYITELEYSTSESYTESYSFTVDVSKSDFYCWNQIVTGSASVGLGFIAEVSLGAGLNIFESSGRRGWTYEFSMSTISTTATEENRQTIAHFEDDDGTPIGQHDQFGLHIFRDLRFNTFGYQIIPEFTYTSNPYEHGTLDRRPPKMSEILELSDFIGGDVLLQAIAVDDETGVKSVKIYYDNDPVFNPPDSELLVTLTQVGANSDVYDYLWSTTSLHGTYYLVIVSEDNQGNFRISTSVQVQIDNVLPESCQLFAYGAGIFEGPIALYTTTFDTDSGIAYVEYWDGDPTNVSSSVLGLGFDASNSYRYIWATDTNGSNDGLHYIFARAYDMAGNYRDSTGFEMEVDTYKEPKSSPFASFGTILIILTVLTIYVRKRDKK